MTFTAAELRRRARDELRELARRREAVAIETVARRAAAERARKHADLASVAAMEAMAAAAVTFGGPEAASSVTGIPPAEFRAARRGISAERAVEFADQMSSAVIAKRLRRGSAVPVRIESPTAGLSLSQFDDGLEVRLEHRQSAADQGLGGGAKEVRDDSARTGG
jgi:hypothetical protein